MHPFGRWLAFTSMYKCEVKLLLREEVVGATEYLLTCHNE